MWDKKKPKEIFPTRSEVRENPEFYKNKKIVIKRNGSEETRYYDQDVITGKCYMCQRNNRAQNEFKTQLHHLSYIDYEEDPFLWTIEVCKRCHTRVDEHRKARITKWYDGKHERNIKNLEQHYKEFCMNIGGEFVPMRELCPDRETYDKVMKECEKEKTASKKDTMSSVSRRYY